MKAVKSLFTIHFIREVKYIHGGIYILNSAYLYHQEDTEEVRTICGVEILMSFCPESSESVILVGVGVALLGVALL